MSLSVGTNGRTANHGLDSDAGGEQTAWRSTPGGGARGPIATRRAGPRAEEHGEDCSSP
jgi:hypothetical protein